MEIPTATIHRLQSSIREAASASSHFPVAGPAPPFPSVADAVAAFDSDASREFLCGRCGAAGGLLRGAQSAVCVYCGSARREEGGGIAFRGSAAYQWLIGSLGLDGSETVEFDGESSDPNKSNEAPKNGMVLSDLLDLTLTCPPESRETSGSSISKEEPSAACTLSLSGVNLDSLFIERKEEIAAAAALPGAHTIVHEKQSRNNTSHKTSSSAMHATSKGFHSSGTTGSSEGTNQVVATPGFANWDADFQSTGMKSVVGESKQLDLFKSNSADKSFNFPVSESAITPVVAATNMKSACLEQSEDMDLGSVTSNEGNFFIQKGFPTTVESNSEMAAEKSLTEFNGSSLNSTTAQSNQSPEMGETGIGTDEAFDDWQEFTGGGNQGNLSNAAEHTEGCDPSEIKGIDTWPAGGMESSNNFSGDSSDDWQAFASSSGQGEGHLMKPMEASGSDQGDFVKSVEETPSISLEHSLESNSVDLWSVGNDKGHSTSEIVKQIDDSIDDWQGFTTSGHAQGASSMEVSHVSNSEIDVDSWFIGNARESGNLDLVNGNNVMLDDWQGFASSDRAHHSPSNIGAEMADVLFEQNVGTGAVQSCLNSNNKEAMSTISTNTEQDGLDIWQGFTASGHQLENLPISVSSAPGKEIDSMDLWLTSNVKASNSSEGVSSIDDPSHGWQDFGSFGQAQGNTEVPMEGLLPKDPFRTEPLGLWPSSNTEEFKNLGPAIENNDPFDDWQDFKNSSGLETSLQVPTDAPLPDNSSASRPDILPVEFGSYEQSAPSESQVDKKDGSDAHAVPSDEELERMNRMQQMSDVDALSAICAATTHDSYSISKSEPVNVDVEKLLSQMHDLSFMLKDEISVPNKSVDHSS